MIFTNLRIFPGRLKVIPSFEPPFNPSPVDYSDDFSKLIQSDLNYFNLSNKLASNFFINPTEMIFYRDSLAKFYHVSLLREYDVNSVYKLNKTKTITGTGTVYVYFFANNGTKLYVINTSGVIYQYSLSTPFDIDTITFDNVTKNLNSLMSSSNYSFRNNRNFYITNDGTKLFLVAYYSTSQKIARFDFSTPWDVSTLSLNSFSPGFSTEISFDFEPSGNKVFIYRYAGSAGIPDSAIAEYVLSSPWDISSATYNNKYLVVYNSGQVKNFRFVDNGKTIVAAINVVDNKEGLRIDLDTPYDITTQKNTLIENLYFKGLSFYSDKKIFYRPTGDNMYVGYKVSSSTFGMRRYKLHKNYDLESLLYETTLSFSASLTNVYEVFFRWDGTVFFVLANDGLYYSSSLSTPWVLSGIITLTKYTNHNFSLYSKYYIVPSGLRIYFFKSSENTKIKYFNLSSAYNLGGISSSAIPSNYIDISSVLPGKSIANYFFNSDGSKLFVVTYSNHIVTYNLSSPYTGTPTYDKTSYFILPNDTPNGFISYELNGRKYYNFRFTGNIRFSETPIKRYSVSSIDNNTRAVRFRKNGRTMYFVGNQNKRIYQKHLDTSYDLNSVKVETDYYNFSSISNEIRDLFFKDDGTALYVLDETNKRIRQFSLSTPWDITTATLVYSLDISSQGSSNYGGIFIGKNGTRLYLSNLDNNTIYQFNFTTGWDLSTCSYFFSYTPESSYFFRSCIFFHPEGSLLYHTRGYSGAIACMILPTPWELNSLVSSERIGSYTQAFVSGDLQETHYSLYPTTKYTNLEFSLDGKRFFVVNGVKNEIVSYEGSIPYYLNYFGKYD